jgi:uridine kinase
MDPLRKYQNPAFTARNLFKRGAYVFFHLLRSTKDRKRSGAVITECDEQFHHKIMQAADAISANIAKNPIVLMSGPSGSGKTTAAQKIEAELKNRGINTHSISLDDYYKTIDPKTAPRTPEGEIAYESPQCIDSTCWIRHFARLAWEWRSKCPIQGFHAMRPVPSSITPLRLRKTKSPFLKANASA